MSHTLLMGLGYDREGMFRSCHLCSASLVGFLSDGNHFAVQIVEYIIASLNSPASL